LVFDGAVDEATEKLPLATRRCEAAFPKGHVVVAAPQVAEALNDWLTAAVVYLEVDSHWLASHSPLAAVGEFNEVFNGSAAEAVERLIIIADYAAVLMSTGEQEVGFFLNGVGVLVFINNDTYNRLSKTGGEYGSQL
jgi:hypothetical protein